MNLKEFLKPGWRKIAFTFAWIVLSILLYWANVRSGIGPPIIDSYLIAFLVIQPTLFVAMALNLDTTVLLFLMVVYSYFISCLVIWAYDKVKKK